MMDLLDHFLTAPNDFWVCDCQHALSMHISTIDQKQQGSLADERYHD